MQKVYIGIDLGGTYIKGGIADAGGNVLVKDSCPSEAEQGAGHVMELIAALVKKMMASAGIAAEQVAGLGAGVPGMIDSKHGVVMYNNNLGWRRVPFAKTLKKLTGFPVAVSNDANVAALGEAKFGTDKDIHDLVLITLGTGVGGGVIIGGKLFEGNLGAGAELGHMVIRTGGEKCTCGRRGCFEAYASATALINQTKKAMQKDLSTQMWTTSGGNVDNVNGKTAWDTAETDETARKTVDKYVKYLADGLANIANIFRPQVILLGGGISKQGESLLEPVRKEFKKRIYGGSKGPAVDIRLATLRNDAGFLGGIALAQSSF